MLTILSYKTNINYLIFHLEQYKIVEVSVGDNFEAIIAREKFPKTLLFHIDLTNYKSFFSDTKDPHAVARKFGIRVLNFGLYDISKKRLQQILMELKLPSTYIIKEEKQRNEMVIVKSDLNFGGRKERELLPWELTQLGIAYDFSKIPRCNEYRVLEALRVSEDLWKQGGIVIEKFIRNDQGSYIRVFKYFERYVLVKLTVPGKEIKKMSDSRDRVRFYYEMEQIPLIANKEINDAAQVADRFFTGWNIDFGGIDMVTDSNGVNYIVDFNDTPFWGRPFWGEWNETKLISYLSKNNISLKYLTRKTFNNLRKVAGL
jgi:hypothetical protein